MKLSNTRRAFLGSVLSCGMAMSLAGCGGGSGPVVPTPTPVPTANPSNPLASLPGHFALAKYGYSGIELLKPDGKRLRTFTEGNDPALSPDGNQLAFVSDKGLEILNFQSGKRQFLTRNGNTPQWSFDSKSLCYVSTMNSPQSNFLQRSSPSYTSGLWVINADGTGQKQLTLGSFSRQLTQTISTSDFDASWHPSGRFLTFVRHTLSASASGGAFTSKSELWDVDLNGSASLSRVRFAPKDDRLHSPVWNRDGVRLAFIDDQKLTLATTGSTPRVLQRSSEANPFFSVLRWSPDGRDLALGTKQGITIYRESAEIGTVPNTSGLNDFDWTGTS